MIRCYKNTRVTDTRSNGANAANGSTSFVASDKKTTPSLFRCVFVWCVTFALLANYFGTCSLIRLRWTLFMCKLPFTRANGEKQSNI